MTAEPKERKKDYSVLVRTHLWALCSLQPPTILSFSVKACSFHCAVGTHMWLALVADPKLQFSADSEKTHLCWGDFWPVCFRSMKQIKGKVWVGNVHQVVSQQWFSYSFPLHFPQRTWVLSEYSYNKCSGMSQLKVGSGRVGWGSSPHSSGVWMAFSFHPWWLNHQT